MENALLEIVKLLLEQNLELQRKLAPAEARPFSPPVVIERPEPWWEQLSLRTPFWHVLNGNPSGGVQYTNRTTTSGEVIG